MGEKDGEKSEDIYDSMHVLVRFSTFENEVSIYAGPLLCTRTMNKIYKVVCGRWCISLVRTRHQHKQKTAR